VNTVNKFANFCLCLFVFSSPRRHVPRSLLANLYFREYLFVFMFAASAREQETLHLPGAGS